MGTTLGGTRWSPVSFTRKSLSGGPEPIATHEVRGGGGVRLHAREWGNPNGPALLFIHGWSQCDLCWSNQVNGQLADTFRIVTFDLRGHGLSEKPLGVDEYASGKLWADDLAAVIEQIGLEQPHIGHLVVRRLRRRRLSTGTW